MPENNFSSKPTDEELMQWSAKGDRAAFEALYERYFSKLVWYSQQMLKDQQKAEDTVQEVFMKIIEKPLSFDANRRFSTWVYSVTSNACKNILRDEQRRLELLRQNSTVNQSYQQEHSYDKEVFRKRFNILFETLNEKEKNIFRLRFQQELSIKETAEILEIPEGSVKSGVFYLLKKIGHHLKDHTYGQ